MDTNRASQVVAEFGRNKIPIKKGAGNILELMAVIMPQSHYSLFWNQCLASFQPKKNAVYKRNKQ